MLYKLVKIALYSYIIQPTTVFSTEGQRKTHPHTHQAEKSQTDPEVGFYMLSLTYLQYQIDYFSHTSIRSSRTESIHLRKVYL